jgi:hypothetical protein
VEPALGELQERRFVQAPQGAFGLRPRWQQWTQVTRERARLLGEARQPGVRVG